MELLLRAEVHPTEDPDKVGQAVLNIFPSAKLVISNGIIEGLTDDPGRFLSLLRDQHIRDTAVSVLMGGLSDDTTHFFLNKQVAFVSKVNFTDGSSSLGDIEVVVGPGALKLIEMADPSKDITVQNPLNTYPSNDGKDETKTP